MSDVVSPVRHYAQSVYRTACTPCGKEVEYVATTHDPNRVTCAVCCDEMVATESADR